MADYIEDPGGELEATRRNTYQKFFNSWSAPPPGTALPVNTSASSIALLKQLGTQAADRGAQVLSAIPTAWDLGAQGIETLANKFLPNAVSGALRDARQFVQTNPNARRHRYEDVTGTMAGATGIPFGNLPPFELRPVGEHVTSLEPITAQPDAGYVYQAQPRPANVSLVPVNHDPWAVP
jgi:hypothetical protein